jgi:hypothetical protein
MHIVIPIVNLNIILEDVLKPRLRPSVQEFHMPDPLLFGSEDWDLIQAVNNSSEILDKDVDVHPSCHHAITQSCFLQAIAHCRAKPIDRVPQDDELIISNRTIAMGCWMGPVPMVGKEAIVARLVDDFTDSGPGVPWDVDEVDFVICHACFSSLGQQSWVMMGPSGDDDATHVWEAHNIRHPRSGAVKRARCGAEVQFSEKDLPPRHGLEHFSRYRRGIKGVVAGPEAGH